MSTQPRIPSAVPGQPENFASVMAHTPAAVTKFFALYSEFWQRGIVSVQVKELTRLRNARITDCGY
jgi:hypothetical protein